MTSLSLGAIHITEKYRPEPGLKPRVSRLTHEYSTTELSKPIQFCYLNFRVLSIYQGILSCVCGGAAQTIACAGTGVAHVCMSGLGSSTVLVTWYLYLSTYLSVLDVLEYLVYGNVKVLVLVLVLDQKVLGTYK